MEVCEDGRNRPRWQGAAWSSRTIGRPEREAQSQDKLHVKFHSMDTVLHEKKDLLVRTGNLDIFDECGSPRE